MAHQCELNGGRPQILGPPSLILRVCQQPSLTALTISFLLSLYSAELNSRLTILKMKGSLTSLEGLLKDPHMNIFFNNAKAFNRSLLMHDGSNIRALRQLNDAISSDKVLTKGRIQTPALQKSSDQKMIPTPKQATPTYSSNQASQNLHFWHEQSL